MSAIVGSEKKSFFDNPEVQKAFASASSAPAAPATPKLPKLNLDPGVLTNKINQSSAQILIRSPQSEFEKSAYQLDQILCSVLSEWRYLKDYPEQQVVIAGIIERYLSETVASFLSVPARLRVRAEEPAKSSLDLLYEAAEEIHNAIGQDDLAALEGQRDSLAIQFGKLSDYEP